jgi:hypothetical protein
VRPENLGQFLAWMEHQAEYFCVSICDFSLLFCDFSLLSDEFSVLELTERCDIFSSSNVSVSNFQNCNQQIEAISSRIIRLEERVSSSLRQSRNDCEAKQAEMKSDWEKKHSTFVTRLGAVERSISLLGSEFEGKITDSSSRITGLDNTVKLLQTDMNAAKENLAHVGLDFPLKEAKSLEEISPSLSSSVLSLYRPSKSNDRFRCVSQFCSNSDYRHRQN